MQTHSDGRQTVIHNERTKKKNPRSNEADTNTQANSYTVDRSDRQTVDRQTDDTQT